MVKWSRLGFAALAAAGALALAEPVAHATAITTFTSTLNATNDSALGSGPFGTVGVSLAGTTATITFTANSGYGFVDSNVADVNLSASGSTFGNSCATCTAILTDTGAANAVDGLGSFNQTTTIGNASNPLSTIVFTETNSAFTTADTVLVVNSLQFDAAAHVSLLSAGGATTGFVGEGPGTPSVPEPASLALLGTALLGLGFLTHRRKSTSV